MAFSMFFHNLLIFDALCGCLFALFWDYLSIYFMKNCTISCVCLFVYVSKFVNYSIQINAVFFLTIFRIYFWIVRSRIVRSLHNLNDFHRTIFTLLCTSDERNNFFHVHFNFFVFYFQQIIDLMRFFHEEIAMYIYDRADIY